MDKDSLIKKYGEIMDTKKNLNITVGLIEENYYCSLKLS